MQVTLSPRRTTLCRLSAARAVVPGCGEPLRERIPLVSAAIITSDQYIPAGIFRELSAQEGSSDPRLERWFCCTMPVLSASKGQDLKLGHLSPGPYFGVGDKCTNYRLCQMFPPRSEGGDIWSQSDDPWRARCGGGFALSSTSWCCRVH